MRRPLANTVALLAVLVQVLLGAATPLGVVLCLGDSHAAIELASEDCCAPHHGAAAALEPACCADVPLHAEASLNDAQRTSHHLTAPAIIVTVASVLPPASSAHEAGDLAAALAPDGFARRSVALRL